MIKKSNNSFNYCDWKSNNLTLILRKKYIDFTAKAFICWRKKNLYKNKMKLIQIVKTCELGV